MVNLLTKWPLTPWPSITQKILKSFKLYSDCNTKYESWLTFVNPSSFFPAWLYDPTFLTCPSFKALTPFLFDDDSLWGFTGVIFTVFSSFVFFFSGLFFGGLWLFDSSSSSSSTSIKFILKSPSSESSSIFSWDIWPLRNEGDK